MKENSFYRLIAFYLPQYHPIPENDKWWGKGFTEWTNVVKARKMFPGHYQPRIPADLGFYDLRLPETRIAQAEMARKYGIEGFCYWHYWFNGKKLLERPFSEVLKTGIPDFPFCLGWANESWTGIWHGSPDKILIEQTYPGKKDDEAHFNYVLESMFDKRYIRVEGKPLFIIYKPNQLKNPKEFTEHWRELALKSGLKDLYVIGISDTISWVPEKDGFDASILHNPGITCWKLNSFPMKILDRLYSKIQSKSSLNNYFRKRTIPHIFTYKNYQKNALISHSEKFDNFPCVVPNWDNTPRCRNMGIVLHNSTPQLFQRHMEDAIKAIFNNVPQKRIIFIKSWNEWAEGNYLEPDQKYGKAYLKAIRNALSHLT